MFLYRIGANRRPYWTLSADEAGAFPIPNLWPYMHGQRFELITRFLNFGDNVNLTDKLCYFRGWIDAVNAMFAAAVTPGREIVLDESIVENKNFDKADCVVYIKRKPSLWGHEFWTLIDCSSGILLGFELNEGKPVNPTREFYEQYGATLAITLRAVKVYFNSFRILYIDSWFQSVKTCMALLGNDIYNVGIVKTAHKNYPCQTLEAYCADESGAMSAVWIKHEGHHISALQWRSSPHHKLTMLYSAYSCAPADKPYVFTTGREVEQPKAVQQWYKNFGSVNSHQGGIWKTGV